MKKLILVLILIFILISITTVYAVKEMRASQITLWDKNGNGTIDEIEVYWAIGTTDDKSMIRSFRRQYTQETKFINPAGDLKNIDNLTIIQLITKIKNDIKTVEKIQ